ncbi:MAG: hypothetical protein GX683_05685 [Ruminococcaceae bacterium]|nr:hypothetical protein [Oscillospiraceae bacterium]
MAKSCKTQTAEFYCPRSVVWHILTSCGTYKDWYGYPEPLDLIETVPEFSLGAKLMFKDDTRTHVVTEFDLNSRLAISTANETNEFSIAETSYGCKVMLVTTLTVSGADFNGTERAHEIANLEVLSKLKSAAYRYEETIPGAPTASGEAKKQSAVKSALSSILQGYKSPITAAEADKEAANNSTSYGSTEQDVHFSVRSCVIAIALFVLMVATLSVSFGCERSDIVPSSGLSVMESEFVNEENAVGIYIGQKKNELELMLSCTGLRLSSDEYCYDSLEKDENGEPVCRIYVIYDAYANVRRFGYVNYVNSKSDVDCAIKRYNRLLYPGMNALEVEDAIGVPCSAFYVDKSGLMTVYFGVFNTEKSVFSTEQKSELVIKLNTSSQQVDAQFYYPYDSENPLAVGELTKSFRRQYSNYSLFLADKLSLERAFLIFDKSVEEVGTILDTKDEEIRELNGGEMHIYNKYVLLDNVQNDRYRYATNYYYDGIAEEVSFENLILEQREDMLADSAEYGLRIGMTRYEVYDAIGELPSALAINYSETTLCYGKKIASFSRLTSNYELVLVFDTKTDSLSEIFVNY